MNKLQALVSAISLTITATLLIIIELAAASFPSLSGSDYTPQPQEIKPDFYN